MFRRFNIVLVAFVSAALAGIHFDGPSSVQAQDQKKKIASENLLPATTKAWFSVPDGTLLEQQFQKTQFGQLTKDETLKPFIDSIRGQVKSWVNQKNVRLGLRIDDLKGVRSGEFCLAGILPEDEGDQKLGRGLHGMVLLVDVSETEEAARELLTKIDEEMLEQGATREEMEDVHGVTVSCWKLKPRPNSLRKNRAAYQAIAGGWVVASDNEDIFRDIVRRAVKVDAIVPDETLASTAAFKNVAAETKIEGVEQNHVRWFIDPFGYLQLAQAVADEEQEFRQRRDDWANTLKKLGFGAFQGIGGIVNFATYEHEIVHRTFIYAPRTGDERDKRVFGLVDFRNRNNAKFTPPAFVPYDSSAYFSGVWDMGSAVKNVGDVVDAFLQEEGLFEQMLVSFKTDMKIDLYEVVDSFDNQLFIVSEKHESKTGEINDESERVLIALKLKDNADVALDAFKKNLIGPAAEMKIGEIDVLEIDTTAEDPELENLDDPFDDSFDDLDIGSEEEEETPKEFSLFEKRYIAEVNGYLLIANRKSYLEKILALKQTTELEDCEDFKEVATALQKLSDEKRVSFQQFGRIDQAIKANYEMLRTGKMGTSKTVLGRVLNRVMTAENDPEIREQQVDGSKLPADFDKHVAPYFGPMGWVVETTKDGWLITGVVLKKNSVSLMVKNNEEQDEKTPRR